MALTETAQSRRFGRSMWLRMGVSAALLAVLVIKIHPDHIVPDHPTAGTLAFLVAGLVLMTGSFVLAAWRWQRVLAVFDAPVSLRTLFKHYLAGQFVGNVAAVDDRWRRPAREPRDQGRRRPRRRVRLGGARAAHRLRRAARSSRSSASSRAPTSSTTAGASSPC